jgi:hypothetical protein
MHPLPPTFRLPACCSYPSDDINKFLWMVRIGGGVFPEIKEPNYLAADGAQAWGNGGGRPWAAEPATICVCACWCAVVCHS